MRFVLDTCIFNRPVDGKFDLCELPAGSSVVATPIQVCELEATKRDRRRAELLAKFDQVAPAMEPVAFCFDVAGAGLDEGVWSDDTRIDRIREALDATKPKPNNMQDALTAGVALKEGYALVTADELLADVAESLGILVHKVK